MSSADSYASQVDAFIDLSHETSAGGRYQPYERLRRIHAQFSHHHICENCGSLFYTDDNEVACECKICKGCKDEVLDWKKEGF